MLYQQDDPRGPADQRPQLEALEPRLLLDAVQLLPGQPYLFEDLSGNTIRVFCPIESGGTIMMDVTIVTDNPDPALDVVELNSVEITNADEDTDLIIRSVGSAGLNPIGTGAAVFGYGAGPSGADLMTPAGTGVARVGSITTDGSVGDIIVDGLVHDLQSYGGSVQTFYAGYLYGEVEVFGSVGQFRVGVSARGGDPDKPAELGAPITIYGSLGTMAIGGDLVAPVTIGEDIPPGEFEDIPDIYEQERPTDTGGIGAVVGRNDTAPTAEPIASVSGAATLHGRFEDTTVGTNRYRDFVDFYSFGAAVGQQIDIVGGSEDDSLVGAFILARATATGYEVLGWDYDEMVWDDAAGDYVYEPAEISYAVEGSGQYLLGVANTVPAGEAQIDPAGVPYDDSDLTPLGSEFGYLGSYVVDISGMAQTGLGVLSVGADLGAATAGASVTVETGSAGQVVIGGSLLNSTVDVPRGSLTYISASDYQGGFVVAGEDLGVVTGGAITSGDFQAGGDIQRVDISGNVGNASGWVTFTAGRDVGQVLIGQDFISADVTAGRDIQMADVGGSISGVWFTAGQYVGQILVGQTFSGSRVEANSDWVGNVGLINLIDVGGDLMDVDLATGPGGDVRFVNVGGQAAWGGWWRSPHNFAWDSPASERQIVDDNGSVIELALSGPIYDDNNNLLAPGGHGSYLTYPVEYAVGVVTLNLTLRGNATVRSDGDAQVTQLDYTSRQTQAPIESLHLLDAGAGGRLDVYHLTHTGMADTIENQTGGGLIAGEVEWVRNFLWDGPVGKMDWPDGDPTPLPSPVQITTAELPQGQFAGPLHGLLARGNLASVRTNGAIGDVICLQTGGTGGYIRELIINADGVDDPTKFEGLEGFLFAHRIEEMDVGEGVAPWTGARQTGILAETKIHQLWVDGPDTRVQGPIWAGNNIDRIDASGGAVLEHGIIALDADQWTAYWYTGGTSWNPTDTIQRIMLSGPGTAMDGAWVEAGLVMNILGVGDCGGVHNTWVDVLTDINRVEIDGPIVNSSFDAEQNINKLISKGANGKMEYVWADAVYEIGVVCAPEITDSSFSAERYIGLVAVVGDVSDSWFYGGGMGEFAAGGDLSGGDFEFAGPLDKFWVGGSAFGWLRCTGPNADVGLISAAELDMEILVEGYVDRIETTAVGGEMWLDLNIRGDRAGLGQMISAGAIRTWDAEMIIEGPVGEIVSHGMLLDPGTLVHIDGDVTRVAALNGPGEPGVIAGSVIVNGYLGTAEADAGIEGLVEASRGMGTVTSRTGLNGTVTSGAGINSLQVTGGDLAGTVTVRDNLTTARVTESGGAGGELSGTVTSLEGSLGTVSVSNDITGTLQADQNINSVTAGGDVAGVLDALRTVGTVSAAALSGRVHAGRKVTTVNVTGSLSGTVESDDLLGTITAGSLNGATLAARGDFTTLRVLGDATDSHALSGYGLGADGALGGGDDVLAGGDFGLVDVLGDWVNSVAAAGVGPGGDGVFGTTGDDVAPGQSDLIRVRVAGTAVDGAWSRYGFFADTALPNVSVGGTALPVGHASPSGAFHVDTVAGDDVAIGDGIPLISGTPVVLTDQADGDQITVTLDGPGAGMILTDTGQLDPGDRPGRDDGNGLDAGDRSASGRRWRRTVQPGQPGGRGRRRPAEPDADRDRPGRRRPGRARVARGHVQPGRRLADRGRDQGRCGGPERPRRPGRPLRPGRGRHLGRRRPQRRRRRGLERSGHSLRRVGLRPAGGNRPGSGRGLAAHLRRRHGRLSGRGCRHVHGGRHRSRTPDPNVSGLARGRQWRILHVCGRRCAVDARRAALLRGCGVEFLQLRHAHRRRSHRGRVPQRSGRPGGRVGQ